MMPLEANEPPLKHRRDEQCLRYLYKLKSNYKYPQELNILNNELRDEYDTHERAQKPLGIYGNNLIRDLGLSNIQPTSHLPTKYPPWTLKTINICLKGATSHRNTNANIIRGKFMEHNEAHHRRTQHIYTDGSKINNKVGYAAVTPYGTIRGSLPDSASVFTAELHALKAALRVINERKENRWTVFSDSQSALDKIENYKSNHPIAKDIQDLLTEAQNQKKLIVFCKVPAHVGIRGNERADIAAKEATEIPGKSTETIPYRDIFQSIKMNLRDRWQEQWNYQEAKLRNIKPTIKYWPVPTKQRSHEVKITRLRIGHTRLTHGHYMERRAAPTCSYCPHKILTIKHFLIDCQKYDQERYKYNLDRELKDLLGENCEVEKVVAYLRDTGLYNEI